MRLVPILSVLSVALLAVPARAADEWKVDPVHSSLLFKVKHFNAGYVWGMIHAPAGKVVWDEADPANSAFEVTAKAEAIATGNEKRDQHLKSPDFFNAKQFPTLSFKSTSVKKLADSQYEVTGDLTIRGKTQRVTTILNHVGTGSGMQGEARTGFEGTFTINRADFDVAYMPQAIGNEVTITVAIEATK